MGTWLERQIGILLAVIAVCWAIYCIVHAAHGFPATVIKLGPMQLFTLGLLLWLHGKFRRFESAAARDHLKAGPSSLIAQIRG